MKRFLALFLSSVLLLSSLSLASAAPLPEESVSVEHYEEVYEEDGVTVTEELTVYSNARSNQKTAYKTGTYEKSGTTIAEITLKAVFSYNGSSVSVLSKSVSQCNTYNGWSFSQTSLTSSGGTVTLTGKLTKLLNSSVSVNLTLSCDKDGNIT